MYPKKVRVSLTKAAQGKEQEDPNRESKCFDTIVMMVV
jgi:hypothetical protein